ncbi:MAG: VOC family protein [Alphaproteobacteria bacterium]
MADGKPGSFFWNELMTPDPAAAAAFYKAVVGWDKGAMPMPGGEGGEYHLWQVGDETMGGMMQMSGPQFQGVPPHWMAYVHVADVDAAAAKAGSSGGAVHAPPFDVPGVGRIAIVADPAGAMLGLITPAARQD